MNPESGGGGSQTVLIAEDDEELVATIQEFAEALGLRAIVAEDGESAIDLCASERPIVCFFDMLLPKLSGFEACKAIKESAGRSAPVVIMMSGIITDASMVAGEMKDARADDFVTKPFPLVRLCEVIALRVPSLAKAAMRLHQERSGGGPAPEAAASSRPSRSSRQSSQAPRTQDRVRDPEPPSTQDRRGGARASKPEKRRPPEKRRAEPEKRVPLRAYKALLVEDSADLRAIYAEFARRLGLDVVEAASGPEAIEQFEAQKPDLCLVDLLLPGKNGMEVCKEIKAKSPEATVIAMSAVYRNMSSLTKDLAQYGADDYIHKPFGLAALRELLAHHLPEGVLKSDNDPLNRFTVDAVARDVGGHLSTLIPGEGSLAATSFSSLVFRARARSFTGRLDIDRDGVVRSVYFKDGLPDYATSSSSDEGLDAILVQQGHVKLNDLNEIVLHEDYSGRLTEAILDENLVARHILEQAEAETVRQVLLSCFRLDGGKFSFHEGDREDVEFLVETNPVALIREGVLKASSQNQIAQRLGDMVQHYVLRTPWFDKFLADFPTEDREGEFLDAIDGDGTLSQLMGRRILEMNQTLGVIWALYQARMIIFSEQQGGEYSIQDLAPSAAEPAPKAVTVPDTLAPVKSGPAPPRAEESLSLWSQLFGSAGADF